MAEASPRKAGIYVTTVFLVALAAASGYALHALGASASALADLRATLAGATLAESFGRARDSGILPWLLIPTLGPLLAALLLLVLAPRSRSPGAPAAESTGDAPAEEVSPPDPSAPGLRLLAALQEEARLIDFVREDLDEYSDDQVGAAVRGIHASLRKAIEERLTLAPVLEGEDGDSVEVPADFEPALIRVTGNPQGDPPYRGVLRHGGWRARGARLPSPTPGSDAGILAPAEVEVGGE